LDALKRFWEYIKVNPRQNTINNGRTAYVLPKDYGYGFRGPTDSIWGFWGPDNLTSRICSGLSQLFTQYGEKLDIIYDYGLTPGNNYGYERLIFWNDSSLIQPTTSEENSPPLWPAPTQTAPSDPPPIENLSSPVDYTLITIAIVAVTVVTVPTIMFRKRQHCITFNQTGIGRDFAGTILVIDGKGYDKYGATFWWDHGSRHTIEFKSPITVNHSKQYILVSTNGLSTDERYSFRTSRQTTITGNYQLLFKTSSPLHK
jgi:hypothetical protein